MAHGLRADPPVTWIADAAKEEVMRYVSTALSGLLLGIAAVAASGAPVGTTPNTPSTPITPNTPAPGNPMNPVNPNPNRTVPPQSLPPGGTTRCPPGTAHVPPPGTSTGMRPPNAPLAPDTPAPGQPAPMPNQPCRG